jgi:hypothetical protein
LRAEDGVQYAIAEDFGERFHAVAIAAKRAGLRGRRRSGTIGLDGGPGRGNYAAVFAVP